MIIPIINFKGELPILHAKKLPEGYAKLAENCNLEENAIAPLKNPTLTQSIAKSGTIKTIYLLDDTWIYWTDIVNVVEAPVENGDHRIFFTGTGSYPMQTDKTNATSGAASTYPTVSRRFGVLKPDPSGESALTLEPQGTGTGTAKRTVSYFYTCVDEFGNESQPSTPTATVTIEENQYVRLKNFKKHVLASTGNDIEYFRLYRVVTGESVDSSDWNNIYGRPANLSATGVLDLPVTTVSSAEVYVYDANDGVSPTDVAMEYGSACPSGGDSDRETWYPPDDDMEGLIEFQHSVLAGFVDNVLYMSEPYYYHAFPYDRKVGHNIVAMGAFYEMLVVATEGFPYVFIGTHPASMERRKLDYKKPCLAARGLVSTNIGVIWPTYDGLFWTDGTTADVITKNVISQTDWQAIGTLANMISAYWKNWYIAFFYGDDAGFIFDLESRSLIRFDLAFNVYGIHTTTAGNLYIIGYDSGYKIYQWGAGSNMTFEYDSRIFELSPINIPFLKLVGDFPVSSSVTAEVYADGVKKDTKTFSASGVQRLSSGFRARDWYVKLKSSTATVTSAALGTSNDELKGV